MNTQVLLSSDALLAYLAYFFAVASPGPSNLSIMSIAMTEGRKSALIFATGVISGSLFWGVLAALGLSAALTAFTGLLLAIKIFGGLYLLWLASKSACAAMKSNDASVNGMGNNTASEARAKASPVQFYSRGLGLHLTNPKAILAWVSIVSLALPVGANTAHALTVIAGCVSIGIVVFLAYALLFSTATARSIYQKIRRVLEGVLAFAFAAAGMKLLMSRD